MEGRIIAGYATIHRDDFIPLWAKLGEAVHSFDCKFIMQLSHSGRQMDLPGRPQPAPADAQLDQPQGAAARLSLPGDDARPRSTHTIAAFARGAWRAREAGLDGVELHAANGYLFTQFLSSGHQRPHRRIWRLARQPRALPARGDRGDPRRRSGATSTCRSSSAPSTATTSSRGRARATRSRTRMQVAKWCESAGADAIHVSTGSLFPHPLNPPGDFSFETLAATYDAMISLRRLRLPQLPAVPLPAAAPDLPLDLVPHEEGPARSRASASTRRARSRRRSRSRSSTPAATRRASVVREGIAVGRLRRRRDRPLAGRQPRPASSSGAAGRTGPSGPAPTATSACSTRRRTRWAATSSPASRPATR